MDAQQVFIPAGHPNRPGTKLDKLLAVVIHYTANEHPDATAEMNAKYFGRKFIMVGGEPFEADGHTPWEYGSAQVIADQNGVVLSMPPNEVAWACGDSRIPQPDGTMAQQPMGKNVFGGRANHFITSIEICDNGDWDAAANNAMQWATDYIKGLNCTIDLQGSLDPQNMDVPQNMDGIIYVVRHNDITGKICPKPFVSDQDAWVNFVTQLANQVNP